MNTSRHSMRGPGFIERVKRAFSRPSVVAGSALLGIALIAAPLAIVATSKGSFAAPDSGLFEKATDTADKVPASVEPSADAVVQAGTKVPTPSDGHRTELIAFYANWDDLGDASLEANIERIDVLMPMWYHLDSSGRVTVDDPQKQARVMELIKQRRPDMKVMPIVNNYDKATEKWNAPEVGKMLKVPAKRKAIAALIVSTLKRDGFDGVNIDFESFTAADKPYLVAFMSELYPLAKKAGLEVSMDVIVAGSAYDHVKLSRHVDYLIPMMYDEHWKTSPSGPISSQGWFDSALAGFYAKVPPEKVVIGIGTYAYDWGKPGQRAASKTYADAVLLSRRYKKPMIVSSSGLNSTFGYTAGGVSHRVWILDAISAFNQMSSAYQDQPRGYAIWRLGAEDPEIWKVVPRRDTLDGSVAASLNTENRTVVYDKSSGLITEGRTR